MRFPPKRDASPAREASPEREPEAKFAVGAAVEARYRGKKKFYPGKILKVLGDQKYEIEYSDGDVERGVDEEMIRALETEPAKKPGGAFAVGAKCEARYKGKKRFYPGRVDADNGDGTYVIKYDDDEVESNVAEELIRLVEAEKASTPPAGDGKYAIGTKIEAR